MRRTRRRRSGFASTAVSTELAGTPAPRGLFGPPPPPPPARPRAPGGGGPYAPDAAAAVGVRINGGVNGDGGDAEEEEGDGAKPGWGKKVGKAWAFLAGDAPPITPHVNSILAERVPPV